MPIERLLYPHKAGAPNPLGIVYEKNGQEEKLKTNLGISKTIKTNDKFFMENLILPYSDNDGKSFRMGWSSVAVLKKCNGYLQVKNICSVFSEKKISTVRELTAEGPYDWEMDAVRNMCFHQITTQAVDTCTLVCIETEEDVMLAHFNMSELGKFVERFSDKDFPLKGANPTVFFSELSKQNSEAYNVLKNLVRSDRFIFFDRSSRNEKEDGPYFSHVEFGVGWDGTEAIYFGDFVYREREDKADSCPCHIFEYNGIGGLQNLSGVADTLVRTSGVYKN